MAALSAGVATISSSLAQLQVRDTKKQGQHRCNDAKLGREEMPEASSYS